MKDVFKIAALFLFAAIAAGYCAIVDRKKEVRVVLPLKDRPLDRAAMIAAIAAVESGNRPQRIGAKGERGRCQFKEATWRHYTSASWELWAPVDCELTRKVEFAHLATLCRELRAEMLSLDPSFIAAAWHHGSAASAAQHARDDDAQRVANLYWDALKTKGTP